MRHTKDEKTILDGQVLLYRRTDKPSKKWQYRFWVKSECKYMRRTTSTPDLHAASTIATKHFYEVQAKLAHDMPVFDKLFLDVADEAVRELREDVKRGIRSPRALGYAERARRLYFAHFFAKKCISAVDQRSIDAYWRWRIDYWTSETGKKVRKQERINRVSEKPSADTLNNEKQFLDSIFNIAQRDGLYLKSSRPDTTVPRRNPTRRKFGFSPEQWKRFVSFFQGHWLNPTTEKLKYQRHCLYYYCLTAVETGTRGGALLALRWRDISLQTGEDGMQYTLFRVQGKDHIYEPVSHPDVYRRLQDWRKTVFNKYNEADDRVFSEWGGGEISAGLFGTRFKNVLKAAENTKEYKGVLNDQVGNEFSPSCLRQTYATFQRRYHGTSYEDLEINMGTSATMLRKHYSHVQPEHIAGRLTKQGMNQGMGRLPNSDMPENVVIWEDLVQKDPNLNMARFED